MNIVFIGAGNLATNLAMELYSKSYNITQVFSRTLQSAETLANKVDATFTNNIRTIRVDADLYIFSVKDSVLEELVQSILPNNGLWVHTSGSMPMEVFKEFSDRYGVLYPFQTFSKEKKVNFNNIPFFIEANNNVDLKSLEILCKKVSDKVYKLSSEKRKYIHLTGVFACNFTNHMYAIADSILKEQDIPFEILLPLIDETTAKIHTLSPQRAQTGPAVRYDENIINKHLSLLEDPLLKSIYTLISESIYESSRKQID